jgi:hypothetical protein
MKHRRHHNNHARLRVKYERHLKPLERAKEVIGLGKQHLVEDQEMKTLQSDGRDIAYIKGHICHVRPGLTEAEGSAVKIFALKGNAVGMIRHATDQLFDREDGNERLLNELLEDRDIANLQKIQENLEAAQSNLNNVLYRIKGGV